MRKTGLWSLLAVAAACGGSNTNGSASVDGTINGQSMTGRDALSNVLRNGSNSEGLIFLTNIANTCAMVSFGKAARNSQTLLIIIRTQGPTGLVFAPASPGTYPVFTMASSLSVVGPVAIVAYTETDAQCVPIGEEEGASGTVTLTAVDPNGAYSGTFDLNLTTPFGALDHVTGTFRSVACAGLTGVPLRLCI